MYRQMCSHTHTQTHRKHTHTHTHTHFDIGIGTVGVPLLEALVGGCLSFLYTFFKAGGGA